MTTKKTMIPGEVCWSELMTTDANKAKEFYKEMFGWQYQDHDMGNMTYTTFRKSDQDLGGILENCEKEKIPPHWLNYILVDSVDESLNKAKNLGAKEVVPPTPVSDFGRFAVIADPTGAHIALWQALKTC